VSFALPLAIWPVPLCPELSLRLISPEVDLDERVHDQLAEAAPFWAFCWASGQVLARFLLDRPELVRGRRVVDFGCGSGIVAIAAARAGAASVVACDADPAALEAARDNAALNRVGVVTSDSLDLALAGCDVLLASDVIYDPAALQLLDAAARRVALTLVCDPERRPLPRALQGRLERLLDAEARTCPDAEEQSRGAAVFRLAPLREAPAAGHQQQAGEQAGGEGRQRRHRR